MEYIIKGEKKKTEKIYKNNNQFLSKMRKEEKNFMPKCRKKITTLSNTHILILNEINHPKNKNIYHIIFVINFKKYFFFLKLYTTIFIYLLSIISVVNKENKENYFFKSSKVTLKIKESGYINFLSEHFFNLYKPSEIYINDKIKSEIINYKYFFYLQNNTINIVRIIWNFIMDNTSYMFDGCDKIIEIDLSKFETSDINSMHYMFNNCHSL